MSATMSLQSVASTLEFDASLAMAAAASTPCYAEVIVSMERANRLRAMASAVRQACDAAPAAIPAKVVPAKAPRASSKVAAAKAPNAFVFWAEMHRAAVDRIILAYGTNWRIKAPVGHTELVSLASGLKSARSERGTVIRWGADHRFPAAQYWDGGVFPVGVTSHGDYARDRDTSGELHRARHEFARYVGYFREAMRHRRNPGYRGDAAPHDRDARGLLVQVREHAAKIRAMGASPWARKGSGHDDAWHLSHGYVQHNGMWVSELGLRASLAHAEAIADAVASKAARNEAEAEARRFAKAEKAAASHDACGPQPLPMVDEAMLAEAAD